MKLLVICFVLITVVFISGCISDNEAYQILFKVFERYTTLNTYKVAVVQEWKVKYHEQNILSETKKEYCGSIKSLSTNTCELPLGFKFKIHPNQTGIIKERDIKIDVLDITVPPPSKRIGVHPERNDNNTYVKISVENKNVNTELIFREGERKELFGLEIENLGIASHIVGFLIKEPSNLTFIIKKNEYNLTYKNPLKFRIERENNRRTIINNGIMLQYDSESGTACKTYSINPISLAYYFSMFIKMFLELYDIEYFGIETIDNKEYHVIKLIPKQERNWEGDKLNEQKIWITKDYLIFRIESYDNGNWKNRITYKDIEINIRIPDEEFEISQDAEILPITLKFSKLEEAQEQLDWRIIVPEYLPDGTELDLIEVTILCGGTKYISLNYKKGDETVLVITETNTDKAGKESIAGIGEICYSSVSRVETTFDGKELEKIMEVFECWKGGLRPVLSIY